MGEMRRFAVDGIAGEGYLARPDDPAGGVLVLHDWWGLLDHLREVCDRLAEEGFTAFAPDFYDGRQAAEPEEARGLAAALEDPAALEKAKAALAFLRKQLPVEEEEIGAALLGFSAGGRMALELASETKTRAVVVFYGLLDPEADLEAVRCPVQGHFAQVDKWEPPDAPAQFFGSLTEVGKETEFYEYPGTEHSFFNEARAEAYDEEAAELAWERTVAFLHRYLEA